MSTLATSLAAWVLGRQPDPFARRHRAIAALRRATARARGIR